MHKNHKIALQALGNVLDPDIKKDLVTLNMIKDLKADDNEISFTVELTTPACPLKEKIKQDCESAIIKVLGDIPLTITMDSNVTTTRLSGTPLLPDVRNIIAVASGKGGVGKSTVTANLATALAKQGAKVGLIDADIFGPSIPIMFNCVKESPTIIEKEGKNILIPIEQYGVKIMSIGFLAPEEAAVVWRGPMASQALKQFMTDTEWGELDYLLVDLPPGTSDIHLTLTQSVPLTGAVIITTPQKVALTDVKKGISMFHQDQINVPVLGLVENMSYFSTPDKPEEKHYIFGQSGGKDLAAKYDIEFLGEIPILQSIRESGDLGYPIVLKEVHASESFEIIAQNIARQVAIKNNINKRGNQNETGTAK